MTADHWARSVRIRVWVGLRRVRRQSSLSELGSAGEYNWGVSSTPVSQLIQRADDRDRHGPVAPDGSVDIEQKCKHWPIRRSTTRVQPRSTHKERTSFCAYLVRFERLTRSRDNLPDEYHLHGALRFHIAASQQTQLLKGSICGAAALAFYSVCLNVTDGSGFSHRSYSARPTIRSLGPGSLIRRTSANPAAVIQLV